MKTPVRLILGAVMAAIILAAEIAMLRAGTYGFTVFLVAPAFLGGLATWVFRPEREADAAGLGALVALGGAAVLLVTGVEGMGCLVMALPLCIPCGALGGWLAHSSNLGSRSGITYILLLPPIALVWDTNAHPPVFAVRSEITIAAPPQQVWRHVIAFPELPEPREWYFHAGLAFPQRARIEGSSVGATRYCEFSTGAFVEPIEIWDPPRVLRFRVTKNPAPMKEWSPYGPIQPKHLHGYLVSKQGEFRLTPLPGGRTLLTGATWYQHGLWPAAYWRWWSDAIIHRIHLRVLNHIRMLAERKES